MARYVASGRLRGLAGIYVENATTPARAGRSAFLAIARARRIPVLTYIRDAQQLFAEYYPIDIAQAGASRATFPPATRALIRVSHDRRLPIARAGRGRAGRRAPVRSVLPAAARGPADADLPRSTRRRATCSLHVGCRSRTARRGRGPGWARLWSGCATRGIDLDLICVRPPGEEPANPRSTGCAWSARKGGQVDVLLPGVRATITPRRRTPGTTTWLSPDQGHLKYLGYGRPLIVTDATETAAPIVKGGGAASWYPIRWRALADGIAAIASADAPPDPALATRRDARAAPTRGRPGRSRSSSC